MDTVDTLVLGRRTYEMFAGFWPNVTSGPEKEFAGKWNALKKVVFSTTLKRAPWGSWSEGTIVHGDVAEGIATLRQKPGKDILVSGSISLAQALIGEAGRRVSARAVPDHARRRAEALSDGVPESMKLRSATALDRGGVSLVYDIDHTATK